MKNIPRMINLTEKQLYNFCFFKGNFRRIDYFPFCDLNELLVYTMCEDG